MTDPEATGVRIATPPDRVDYDENGDLDDVSLSGVSLFRMERMDDGHFWIRCCRIGKPDVVFFLNSERKVTGKHDYD